jgi:hypothetical protein
MANNNPMIIYLKFVKKEVHEIGIDLTTLLPLYKSLINSMWVI